MLGNVEYIYNAVKWGSNIFITKMNFYTHWMAILSLPWPLVTNIMISGPVHWTTSKLHKVDSYSICLLVASLLCIT